MSKPHRPPTLPRGKQDVPAELFAALRRLGAKRPFGTISVRDIAREAGFSTRTFYNHFKSKYDLVIQCYAFDDFAATRRARAGGPLPPWKDRVRDGLRRFRRDRTMFAGALRDMAGPEGLAMTFLAHACRSTEEHILMATGNPLPKALAPVLRHYFAGFVLMLCEWLESPSPKSSGAFLSDLLAALPAPLRPLLL